MLLKSKMLVDRPIKVSAHSTLNSSMGVIRCRDLRDVSEEEIETELASQGVTEIRRVLVRKGQDRVPTDTFFLTFCMTTLPQTITVGYLQGHVSLYVLSPLRCFKCQKFGHIRERCREEEVCGTCSKEVHEGVCNSPALCVTCRDDHPSSSKTCPTWIREKAVQQVKAEKRITFFEAKKIVKAAQPAAGLSYSVALKKSSMISKAVQTEESGLNIPSHVNVVASNAQAKVVVSGGGAVSVSSKPVQQTQTTFVVPGKKPTLAPRGEEVVEVVDKAATPKPPRLKSPSTSMTLDINTLQQTP